ncbi:hypothetical protein CEXT_438611 [Caerostris extrusa]|uniref:Uncharacterized protein n=1 Tax=Caerostris extrusa TaxID=172846 RepID=A0AAV4XBI9_CAEEX|nr:hypothetical protein CEXT_438611 [Caerostris extrusa]
MKPRRSSKRQRLRLPFGRLREVSTSIRQRLRTTSSPGMVDYFSHSATPGIKSLTCFRSADSSDGNLAGKCRSNSFGFISRNCLIYSGLL